MRRIAVTGGNGKLGRSILTELAEHGYVTVNCSRGSREESTADQYQSVDLLDAGETYGALAQTDVDAVVHVGTIPSPVRNPGYVTYQSNVQTAYVVLEAAEALGLDRVVLPSSINVMGATYQDEPTHVEYLPVDEAHPVRPRDPYAVAKRAMEVTADGVARRADAPSIASIRYPWVATDEQLADRFGDTTDDLDAFEDWQVDATRDELFSYLHVEDAGAVARHAVEATFDGHERIWAVADDTSTTVPTERLVEACYADAEVRRTLSGNDPLVDCSKAEELLDWRPKRSWRAVA